MANLWRIELLGGLRARRGAVVIEGFRTRKTGALLALLAYVNRSQARETLIEEIWPDASLETGRNNLRLSLAALRRDLESDGEAGRCVRADRSLVALEGVETDVGELEALLREAATSPERTPLLERALELYRGPLLKGYYEDWIPAAATRLETLASAALETLIGDLQTQGETARAQQWAHRGAELGLIIEFPPNPSARTVAAKSVGAAPIFLSRFFGRESELEQLDSHLSARQNSPWLLTIIGPGGAGKTRLACEALAREALAREALAREALAREALAREALARTSTSAVWIPLEGLTEVARLDEALVAALDVATPPARLPLDCAVEALQNQAPLLCFDNFEHLLPDGADWLARLKGRVAGLRVLATSRARLELEGEALLEIGALELPDSAATADIAASAAAALFLDRARAVNPKFSLFKTNEVEFARLLQQLDGLPLALELAAARAGILSPAQMLRRLQHDADLPPLSRGRAARHHSLSATLSWSLELLDAPQRAFLANLSVFCAPFDLEAAGAVAASASGKDESEVLRNIARLRDASLLRAVPDGEQEQRFVLPETVRAGARRLLSVDERADLARRHALYFVDLAQRIETNIGASQDWHWPLEKVWLDLSAALDWATRAGETAIGLRLASALWLFWRLGGRLREGRTHLEKLLALPELISDDDRLRARGATVAGFLALQMGDYEIAENHLIQAVETASEQPDIRAWALNLSGTSAQRQGRSSAACAYFAQSLELYRGAQPHQRAVGLTALAGALVADGQTEKARNYCRDARVLWRDLSDAPGQGWVEEIEGRAALSANDLVAARAHLEASLQLRHGANAHTAAIGTLDALGELEQRTGRFEMARANYQSALTTARELGLRAEIASALAGLGAAAHALGATEDARNAWQEALVLWRDIGDTQRAQACQQGLRELQMLNRPES